MKKRHIKIYKAFKRKIKKIQDQVCILKKTPLVVNTIFNNDQLNILTAKYKKIPKWCDDTLIKAYQLKFACGISGYKELLHQGHPLPSLRTLREKLENWKFLSGSPDEIFHFLQIKVPLFSNLIDKDCVIVMDEISITPGLCYDNSTGTFVGNVTLPEHDTTEVATHVLVFMLAGISQRWKQVIDYYYTSKHTDGSKFKPLILNYIEKANAIGLNVHAIVSDMGSANQAMWRSFGITAGKYSIAVNKCQHPIDDKRYLYFFHDVCHAFKNFKEGMLNNETIMIPDHYVKSNDLPTNIASSRHFYELLNNQKNSDLKLAPKLSDDYLDRSKHFQKMRLKSASHVLSHDVSTALQFLAEEQLKPEYKTSAWLVENVAKWFQIVSARNLTFTLSKKIITNLTKQLNFCMNLLNLSPC